MLPYVCSHATCDRTSIPDGHCETCHLRFCFEHNQKEHHPCDHLAREDRLTISKLAYHQRIAQLQAAIDSLDIGKAAETHRPGYRVVNFAKINVEDLPYGHYNIHIAIEFDDGVRWTARIHQTGYKAFPRAMGRMSMQGEIVILGWLRDVADVPVPRVLSPMITEGITDFYFQELIPGKPLEVDFPLDVPPSQLATTITDLAKIYIRISNHPFTGIGSLYRDPVSNDYVVGPYINNGFGNREPPLFFGPFRTAGEKWVAIYDSIIEKVKAKEVYGDKRELAYCTFRWIRDAVAGYAPFNTPAESYLFSTDSSADTIMTQGDEGKISGLIDWEGAVTGHRFEAFAAPSGLMDMDTKYDGDDKFSAAELLLADAYTNLGRPDLADCVKEGRVYQKLDWLSGGVNTAWEMYPQLQCLGRAMRLEMPGTMEEFMVELKEKYAEELVG